MLSTVLKFYGDIDKIAYRNIFLINDELNHPIYQSFFRETDRAFKLLSFT